MTKKCKNEKCKKEFSRAAWCSKQVYCHACSAKRSPGLKSGKKIR